MSNATAELIRNAFTQAVERFEVELKPILPRNRGLIQHPEAFWNNYDAAVMASREAARVYAFDVAIEAAARALKTQDALKAGALARRAGLRYRPGSTTVIPNEDGTESVVRVLATAEII